jgi:CTP:molybdopterin cytidylyltransferase MocA
MQVNGLIICAGRSKRLGELKPLLIYNDQPFVVNIIFKLSRVCKKIGIVLGHEAEKIQSVIETYFKIPALNDVREKLIFITNNEFDKGMFTSLQCGVKELIDSEWLLYHFVDQPGLPESFYEEFVCHIDDDHNWIQPSHNKRNGHPILFHNSFLKEIISASPDKSLRDLALSNSAKIKYWECSYPQIFQDIDTIEQYQSLINPKT